MLGEPRGQQHHRVANQDHAIRELQVEERRARRWLRLVIQEHGSAPSM
jgi:hypothetical protein